MRTTPIVNGHAPPPHRGFGAFFTGKGQGYIRFAQYKLVYLSDTHQPRRAVAAFDGRRVGNVVAQSYQSLLNALLATMTISDFDSLQTMTTPMFDDLHMSGCARNAKTGFRLRAAAALTRWIVRHAEYLWKQGTIS